MKKWLLVCFILIGTNAKSQYVTISDSVFVSFLQSNYPGCMNGNQMDTTCAAIINTTQMPMGFGGSNNYTNLIGIQYFKSLINLDCSYSNLSFLPVLPDSLKQLICDGNNLTSISNLPSSLIVLRCRDNQITSIGSLPNTMQYLYCQRNSLTVLPVLPTSLISLNCDNNLLISLPSLPGFLNELSCSENHLQNLPILPNSLHYLSCNTNQLTSLPAMPNAIEQIQCDNNQLTSIPTLPNTINLLTCHNNQIPTLPTLPISLQHLDCTNNNLTIIPTLPSSLTHLYCNNNQLTELPSLPNSLQVLYCGYNHISCFPIFPASLNGNYAVSLDVNPFTCLPNYVVGMNASTLSYPLCIGNNSINNPYLCTAANGISGYTYRDTSSDCLKNPTELGFANVPMKLYNSNNFVSQTYSLNNGVYNFVDSNNIYTIKVDTTAKPYTIFCIPGVDSTITLNSTNHLVSNINFAIECKPGFDIGVQSVNHTNFVFPGQQHQISVVAGDLSQWFQLNCAAGISGQVQIIVSGPITFNGIPSGALTPNISGNAYTYTISDFGNTNDLQAFALLFTTNINAQSGNEICLNINVTPTIGDNNVNNNSYAFCYHVVNSFDPNLKEVYPSSVLPGYEDWLTYTIHFQNTGNAAAHNIYLKDTLDNNLNLETFELINYSHYNTVSLNENILTVNFPNIMLPDSTSDPLGSPGFVQYRIKPKANIISGAQIKNTAYIFFDYNSPVVTNTAVCNFEQPLSMLKLKDVENFKVYPNPANDLITISVSNYSSDLFLTIYSTLGQSVKQITIKQAQQNIDISVLTAGAYYYTLSKQTNLIKQGKLMVE